MQPRTVAIALAAGRVAIGAAMFAAPKLAGRAFIGEAARSEGAQVALRAFAVRDLALGVGTLAALDDPERSHNWVEAGIIADAGDFLAIGIGRRALGPVTSLAMMAMASSASAAGLWLREQFRAQAEEADTATSLH